MQCGAEVQLQLGVAGRLPGERFIDGHGFGEASGGHQSFALLAEAQLFWRLRAEGGGQQREDNSHESFILPKERR
jgi:hypothetical protein